MSRQRITLLPLTPDGAALAAQWFRLVYRVLRDLSHNAGVRRHWDDCADAGLLALLKATQEWREGGGASFKTFAYTGIKRAIIVEAGRLSRIHRRERSYLVSPDGEMAEPGPPGDPERDPNGFDPTPVRQAIARLRPRYRRVLSMLYGIDGKGGLTYEEAGRVLGVSGARVGQLHDLAIGRLARQLVALARRP